MVSRFLPQACTILQNLARPPTHRALAQPACPPGFRASVHVCHALSRHLARAEVLFTGIEGQGARLPSQRRYEARARSEVEGVQIPLALFNDLQALLKG